MTSSSQRRTKIGNTPPTQNSCSKFGPIVIDAPSPMETPRIYAIFRIYLIFLETTIIGLHFAAYSMDL